MSIANVGVLPAPTVYLRGLIRFGAIPTLAAAIALAGHPTPCGDIILVEGDVPVDLSLGVADETSADLDVLRCCR